MAFLVLSAVGGPAAMVATGAVVLAAGAVLGANKRGDQVEIDRVESAAQRAEATNEHMRQQLELQQRCALAEQGLHDQIEQLTRQLGEAHLERQRSDESFRQNLEAATQAKGLLLIELDRVIQEQKEAGEREKATLAALNQGYEELKESLSASEQSRNQTREALDALQVESNRSATALAESKEECTKLSNQLGTVVTQAEILRTERDDIQSALTSHRQRIDRLQNKLERLEKAREIVKKSIAQLQEFSPEEYPKTKEILDQILESLVSPKSAVDDR